MRKLLIILGLFIIVLNSNSQETKTFRKIRVNESIKLKDSVVVFMYADTLINKTYVDNLSAATNYNRDSIADYNVDSLIMSKADTIYYADTAFNVYPGSLVGTLIVDSLRNDTLWFTDGTGSVVYLRNSGDSLFFWDTEGEKAFANLAEYTDISDSIADLATQSDVSDSASSRPDNAFNIFNITDNTKIIDFDASNITTGNEWTIIMADKDVDLDQVHAPPSGTDGQFLLSDGSSGFATDTYLTTDNILIGQYGNTRFGLGALANIGPGMSMTAIGGGAGALCYGDGNTMIGSNALAQITNQVQCIAIGRYAGYYNTSLSNRLFINAGNRTSLLKDTTQSIIYGVMSGETYNQRLYLNANTYISDKLIVTDSTDLGDRYKVGEVWQTDSTFYLVNSDGDSIILKLDTAYFDSTHIDVMSMSIGGGDILTTSDTVNNEDIEFDSLSIVKINSKVDSIILNANVHVANNLVVGDSVYIFNADSARFNGNLIVDGYTIRNNYKYAAYMEPDSIITTSLTTNWQYIGNGENNKFTDLRNIGFTFDGDTIAFLQRASDLRDSIDCRITYSCESSTSNVNKTVFVGIFIKSVGESVYREIPQCTKTARTSTAGIYYTGPILTSVPLWLKDDDKIQIHVKCAASTTTLSTKRFTINLFEG